MGIDFDDDITLFHQNFVGEHVQVITSHLIADSTTISADGYLLDEDEEFYYLGAGPDEVAMAIRKQDVVLISILRNVESLIDFSTYDEEGGKVH